MRRRIAALTAFAAAFVLSLGAEPAAAQPPDEEKVTTADGVALSCLFHKASNPAPGDPVVILLYPPGPAHTMLKPEGWGGLADQLNKRGFHVFRFDWRGHGKSTNIANVNLFWNNPFTGLWNQKCVRGYNAFKQTGPNRIDVKKDVAPRYFPVYVNDLAAVRQHLDAKNDVRILNTRSIYLIGAGDAATVGMLWLAAEWQRPAVHPAANALGGAPVYEFVPQPLVGGVNALAGPDIAGAVWLSPSKPAAVPAKTVYDWVKNAPLLRESNPMLFLVGAEDRAGVAQAKFLHNQVLMAQGNRALMVKPLAQTFLTEMKETRLSGVGLLGNDTQLGTETHITKYLAGLRRGRVPPPAVRRNYTVPYFIQLGAFGLKP